MAKWLSSLSTALDNLDQGVRDKLSEAKEQEGDSDLLSLTDRRLKRKNRIEAAKDAAPFGSALGGRSDSFDSNLPQGAIPDTTTHSAIPPAPSSGGYFYHPSTASSDEATDRPGNSSNQRAISNTPPQRSPEQAVAVGGFDMLSSAAPTAMAPSGSFPDLKHMSPLGKTTASPVVRKSPSTGSMPIAGGGPPSSADPTTDRSLLPPRGGSDGGDSVGVMEGSDVRATIKQLQKEVKELNLENDDYEHRILGQEKELKAAAEALGYATSKAAAREGELLDEIKEIRQAKESEKRQMQSILANKDKIIGELQADLAGYKGEVETYVNQVTSLRREIANILEDKDALRRELDVALSNQERGVEGLRSELRAAETTIDDMKAQHTNWMRQAQRREGDLEAINAELTASLASKQRQIEAMESSHQHMGDSAQINDLEMHRLQQELQATQASLELERQHVFTFQREIRALQSELSSNQSAWKEEKESLELKIQKANGKAADQERLVMEAHRAVRESKTPYKEEMDSRLKMVSEQLVKKQEQLDAAICENYAFQARLRSAEQRAESYEKQLMEARAAMGGSIFDLETGGTDHELSSGMRNRGRGSLSTSGSKRSSLRPISRLDPIARNPQVAHVVDILDRCSIAAGHYLRVYPVVRLIFLLYFLLLHLWAFFVLVFHTQHIEEIHGDVGGSFTNLGPQPDSSIGPLPLPPS